MSNFTSVSPSLANSSYSLTNTAAAAAATDWPAAWLLNSTFLPGNIQTAHHHPQQHRYYHHVFDDYDQQSLLPTLYHHHIPTQWHNHANNIQHHSSQSTPILHHSQTHDDYVNADVPEGDNEISPMTPTDITNNTTITTTTTVNNISNNNNNNTGGDDLIHNELVQIFFCILYSTVFVLGVFGNVLVCFVVLRNRAMQTVTNIFITNLALSDILLCVLAVPFTPLYTFMGRWAFGRTLCHLVSFAQGCSIYISTLTLTSIAIDRYFVIIYPFHPRMKLSTCIAIIISIWVIAVLATLPYGMYMKVISEDNLMLMANYNNNIENNTIINNNNNNTNKIYIDALAVLFNRNLNTVNTTTRYKREIMNTSLTLSLDDEKYDTNDNDPLSSTINYCEENWPSEHYRKVFGSLTTILQFVLPFLIISICYIWISMKLNARAKAKPGSKSSRKDEADRDRKKRTNRMLIAMVAVFGVSWLPLNVVNIFDDFYEKSNEWRYYTLLFFVAHSIAMSSTCYNPFLYAWLNENFRKEFKHVLPCFNPSINNNINAMMGRGFNRSDRNTCGPRLHYGGNGGGGGGGGGQTAAGSLGHGGSSLDHDEDNNMIDDDNGITQDTCLNLTTTNNKARHNCHYNNYERNDNNVLSPPCLERGGGITAAVVQSAKQVEILLTDTISYRQQQQQQQRHELNKSCETIELRFTETPFISSGTHTSISIMETTSTTNEMEDPNATITSNVDKHWLN